MLRTKNQISNCHCICELMIGRDYNIPSRSVSGPIGSWYSKSNPWTLWFRSPKHQWVEERVVSEVLMWAWRTAGSRHQQVQEAGPASSLISRKCPRVGLLGLEGSISKETPAYSVCRRGLARRILSLFHPHPPCSFARWDASPEPISLGTLWASKGILGKEWGAKWAFSFPSSFLPHWPLHSPLPSFLSLVFFTEQ